MLEGMREMGRRCDYSAPKPSLPRDSTMRLAEALLGSTIIKRKQQVVIQFDELRDSNTAHTVLRGLQDSYEAPRK